MKLAKRLIVIFSICITCVGCDQSTKILATDYLPKNQMFSYFGDILRIGYTENTGAFLGMGDNLPREIKFWLFTVAVGLFLSCLFIYFIINSKQSLLSLTGFSLVFSGGISNFYDRAFNNGTVIDFLNIGLGSLRTGIFNVADMAIMAGLVVILFVSYQGSSSVEKTSNN